MTVETESRREVQLALQRSNVYGLLSMIYIKEPTAELIEKLREPAVCSMLESLGVVFDPMFEEQPAVEVVEALVLEFTRLYLGPGRHIPPYEAPHIGSFRSDGEVRYGMMWGSSTKEVESDYRRHGFELIPGFRGAPDHIAAELHFLRMLTQEEATAWERGEREWARNLLEEQQAFLEKHLGKWAPSFCEEAAAASRLQFYRTLALLTGEFIRSEMEALPDLVRQAGEPSSA